MGMAKEDLNLGTLVLAIVIAYVIVRHMFFKSPEPPTPRDLQAIQRMREDAAQRILQIFPHVDRRSVLWDLQHTGGNVDVTTERILSGRLATPPVTFQPPPPPGSSPSDARAHSQAASSAAASASVHPDLITRYNLHSKLAAQPPPPTENEALDKKAKGWSSNRDERQAMLHKRREDMIIAARRKMEAKLAMQKKETVNS